MFPSDSKVNSNYQEQRVTNNDRNNKSSNRLQQKKNNYGMRRDRNEQGSSNQDIQENDEANEAKTCIIPSETCKSFSSSIVKACSFNASFLYI